MDRYKLMYEMKTRKITVKKLCEDTGIGVSAFYRKCNGKSEFTLTEVHKILDYLELSTPMGIFFQTEVS